MPDMINHPPHYTDGPPCPKCGTPVECITVTETMDFCRGNAMKYLWRAGKKSKMGEIEDLRKARWYIDRVIANLEKEDPSAIREGSFATARGATETD